MLNSILDAAVVTVLLSPVSAADTAAASSAFVEIPDSEGVIAVIVKNGIITGTITYTFQTASDVGGTGVATIVPLGGALTVGTTSNDPLTQVALFEPGQLKGFLKVIGTIVTGPALVDYTVISIPKNAS